MSWNKIPKPQESSVMTMEGGIPIGLLIAITQSLEVSSVVSGWGDVSKPSTYNWTKVGKSSVYGWTNINKPTT